jgi:hypothetical protein
MLRAIRVTEETRISLSIFSVSEETRNFLLHEYLHPLDRIFYIHDDEGIHDDELIDVETLSDRYGVIGVSDENILFLEKYYIEEDDDEEESWYS